MTRREFTAGAILASAAVGLADPLGLPIGTQVMAAPGGDALTLRVAYALEQSAAEHRVQRPPFEG